VKPIDFRINNKIEFILEGNAECSSLIQDVRPDSLLVTVPLEGLQRRMLPVGETVECVYFGEGSKVYMFTLKVIERVMDNIPLYRITIPDSYDKIQRRNYVRVPLIVPVLYTEAQDDIDKLLREKTPEEVEALYRGSWLRGSTLDLSGGGMKLNTKTPVTPGALLVLIMKADELNIAVKGRVVRCIKNMGGDQPAFHSGIEFIDIPEARRDKIIGFIFERLRGMIRKGDML